MGDHLGITLRFIRPDYIEISSTCFRWVLIAPFLIVWTLLEATRGCVELVALLLLSLR